MMGRATRLCPDIGKEFFRIYDAVDLYAALEPYSAMKPVVTRPSLPFAQLVDELLTVPDPIGHRSSRRSLAKLQTKKRRLKGEHHEAFHRAAGGMEPGELLGLLKAGDVAAAIVAFFEAPPGVAPFLDRFKPLAVRSILRLPRPWRRSGHRARLRHRNTKPRGLPRGLQGVTSTTRTPSTP
jgi:type I restriction enzyme R subunit